MVAEEALMVGGERERYPLDESLEISQIPEVSAMGQDRKEPVVGKENEDRLLQRWPQGGEGRPTAFCMGD